MTARMVPPSDTLVFEEREVPMEILVLGLCRTGTMSMKIALEHLGYGNVYHMSSVFDHDSHARLWIEALDAKFYHGTGEDKAHMMSAEYWDRILGSYSAATDIPSACFAPELMSAYPNAKIILTTRSSQSWLKSMTRTIHALQTSRVDRFLLRFADAHLKTVSYVMDLIFEYYFAGSIPEYGERVFVDHNQAVRDLARAQDREVLEFELGDGWEVLGGFLGKGVPELGFPHVNDSGSFRAAFRLDLGRRILIVSAVVALFVVLGTWILVAWRSR